MQPVQAAPGYSPTMPARYAHAFSAHPPVAPTRPAVGATAPLPGLLPGLLGALAALPLGWSRPDQLTFSPAALLQLARLRTNPMANINPQMLQARRAQQMLATQALPNAERLVEQEYGLRADNAPLTIILEPDMGEALGSASGYIEPDGRLIDQELRLSLTALLPNPGANATNGRKVENDRIVAHEVTHLVMGRTMNFVALPDWFTEGTAEYIAGGAERAVSALRRRGPGLLSLLEGPWQNTSDEYATAYLAVRFLDEKAADGGGIRRVMHGLNGGKSLDGAIAATGAFGSEQDLLARFMGDEGRRWLAGLRLTGAGAKSGNYGPHVVPDTRGPTSSDPLRGFRERWAPLPRQLALQAYTVWMR